MSGLPITDSATEDDLPGYNPPAYEVARVPLEAFNYTLSPTSDNALLLLPPPRSPDSHPQYRISVSLNCLNPFSSITTVRRGASLDGPFVGEIQMGISTLPATVCLGDRQKQLYDVMSNLKTVRTRWTWTFRDDPAQHIRWELNNFSTVFFASTPYPASTHQKIAQFKGAPYTQNGTERTPPSMLRIYPQGQELFDDILITALIVERKRLQPQTTDIGWNY